MSEHETSILDQLVDADSRLARKRQPIQGADVRRVAGNRRKRRRTLQAGLGVVVLVAVGFVVFNSIPIGADRVAVSELKTRLNDQQVTPADQAQLRQKLELLQAEYEILQVQRILGRISNHLEFCDSFPDSVKSIASSNYSAYRFFLNVNGQQTNEPELRNKKLTQLVSFFPGTKAAKQAKLLLQLP